MSRQMEMFESGKPTTKQLIEYNQKLSLIQSELFETMNEGRREYQPIKEIIRELKEILDKYEKLSP